jgi:hypothetical protein
LVAALAVLRLHSLVHKTARSRRRRAVDALREIVEVTLAARSISRQTPSAS